jgi:hypothetical protein
MKKWSWFIVGFLIMIGLVSCDNTGNTLTAPGGVDVVNCAQMPGLSVVATVNGEQHQFNFAVSDQPTYLFGQWFYAEINEQSSVGNVPGVDQIPVNLANVVFTFKGFWTGVYEIIVGIKDKNVPEPTYREIGRYPLQDGSVSIPVAWEDLVEYFDGTLYSVWFQPVGGITDGRAAKVIFGGTTTRTISTCGQLEVSGTLPDGQVVTAIKGICFGSVVKEPMPN